MKVELLQNKALYGTITKIIFSIIAFHVHIILYSAHSYSVLTMFPFQILVDKGIHANLITFVTFLIANSCFHLHDIIVYIIRPIIRLQLLSLMDTIQYTSLYLEFVNFLILHLLVSDYTEEGIAEVGGLNNIVENSSPVVLPQFVRHCLQAKCRSLSLGYVVMLLKDLVRVHQNRPGVVSESLLVHSSSSGNETAFSKVSMLWCRLLSEPWRSFSLIYQHLSFYRHRVH